MSPYERLQLDFADTMEAAAYFADIPIFVLRPRVNADGTVQTAPDIIGSIEAALNTLTPKANKSGVAVTVSMPTVSVPKPNIPGPEEEVITTVTIEEVPFFNMGESGTLKSAEEIGREIRRLFHQRVIAPAGALSVDGNSQSVIDPESGKLMIEQSFRCTIKNPATVPVAAPRISNTETSVTITCATAGATIYYTTNGRMPRADGVGSNVYTAPFTASLGTTIRAAAYKSGLTGSYVSQLTTE